MEASDFSEILVPTLDVTRRHIPEGLIFIFSFSGCPVSAYCQLTD